MQPKSIELIKAEHRGNLVLQLKFEYDSAVVKKAKELGCRWSQTKKSWYLPYQKDAYKKVIAHFKGTAWVDASALFNGQKPEVKSNNPAINKNNTLSKPVRQPLPDVKIPEDVLAKLRTRRYSENTIRTYTQMLRIFFGYFAGKDLTAITKKEIEDYLLHLQETRNFSISSQNQAINAIKFYYEKVLRRERTLYEIERPIKKRTLPKVISKEEVEQLLSQISNLKHLSIVMLLYSAGLRRSEVLNLKKGDINIHRSQITVEQGKGKKDRVTLLSTVLVNVLERYVRKYAPEYYLFEGTKGTQYSATSIASIVKRAGEKAGIPLKVTPHMLRHSFATHLMEQGVETRYIQKLLGHSSLETTARYAHVSTKTIESIKSPLDNLILGDSLKRIIKE